MKPSILILALSLIAIGAVGLVALDVWQSTASPVGISGMMHNGMMDGDGMTGMMGMMHNGMMDGMTGSRTFPSVDATPVPATQAIDREIKVAARNLQFDPARVVLKQGETVRFTFSNQDPYAHNFGSADARIPFILLPANGTASTLWVAAQKGTYTALCTLHPGMQISLVAE